MTHDGRRHHAGQAHGQSRRDARGFPEQPHPGRPGKQVDHHHEHGGDLADARDHALLLIGWKAALRPDDLARLQPIDLHASEQGLSVFVSRSRSRTDRAGHGTTLGIAAPARCPPRPVAGLETSHWRMQRE